MKYPIGVMPNWGQIDRDEFEWIVEQILIREHSAASVVRIPHDAGGDGGIDVAAYYPDRTIIYQLKHYTDGLASKESSRKTQIKRSFMSVFKPKDSKSKSKSSKNPPKGSKKWPPDEWVLVIPCKYTDTIIEFVEKELLAKIEAPPAFEIIDQPKLDAKLMRRPDLLGRLSRDDHFTKLVTLHQAEQSALSGGIDDLESRLHALNGVAAELDPHWTVGYYSDGCRISLHPQPKHPQAMEVSPLGVRLTVDPAELDDSTRDQLRDVIGFGAPGEVVLPPEAVRDFIWTGPEFLAPSVAEGIAIGGSSVESMKGKKVRLSLFAPDDQITADSEGVITQAAVGTSGCTLTATFHRSLQVTMLLPEKAGEQGKVTLELDLQDREPREVHRGITLAQSVRQSAQARIYLDGEQIAWVKMNPSDHALDEGLVAYGEAAADLDIVQDRTGSIFLMPETMTVSDRIWIRILRIILDGGIAPTPLRSFKANSHPGIRIGDPTVNTALVRCEDFNIEVCGHALHLGGGLCFFHPEAHIVQAGEQDPSGSTPFRATGVDGTNFVAYLSDRVRTKTVVTRWDLPDVDEPLTPALPAPEG